MQGMFAERRYPISFTLSADEVQDFEKYLMGDADKGNRSEALRRLIQEAKSSFFDTSTSQEKQVHVTDTEQTEAA